MTRIHFAGVNREPLAKATEGEAILVSYADVQRWPALWTQVLRPRLEAGVYASAMLDSGAFTELSEKARGRRFHVDLEAYAAFAAEWGHLFDQVVTLDDIEGDLERSARNTAVLEAAGVDVVPVFHGREPWEALEDLVARGYRRIGLGFARDRGRISQDQGAGLSPLRWLQEALERIPSDVQVHGFGMTRYATAYAADLPRALDTVDSTTWIAEFRALRTVLEADDARPHGVRGAFARIASWAKVDVLRLVVESYRGGPGRFAAELVEAHSKGQARTVLRRLAIV